MAVVQSRTKYFKSRDLPSDPALSGVLIRLMMAINDISLAADADKIWAETLERRRLPRKLGATTYFNRLIMSHVNEAFKIIDELNRDPNLRAAVEKCDVRTRDNFSTLTRLLTSRERGYLNRFRTKTTFHYDEEVPRETLSKVVEHDPDATWSYSVGSKPLDWHYEIADTVVLRMVVRFVFGVDEPRSPERTATLKELASGLEKAQALLTDFATHFIEQNLR